MPTNEYEGVERLNAVASIIADLKTTYPDAKKLRLSIRFEWDLYINSPKGR